jgi:hypothetical protein
MVELVCDIAYNVAAPGKDRMGEIPIWRVKKHDREIAS